MLPPSNTSLENRSAADRVSLSSHVELSEPREDDIASVDAVVSDDSKHLVMSVTRFCHTASCFWSSASNIAKSARLMSICIF